MITAMLKTIKRKSKVKGARNRKERAKCTNGTTGYQHPPAFNVMEDHDVGWIVYQV